MKILLSALLALGASVVPASAITVNTPVNGANLTSPFQVVASTQTCGGVSAVSMGYSIDSGSAVIEPTSFTATVAASAGAHVLHIKCWGKKTNDQVLLNINVMAAGTMSVTPTTTTQDIAVSTPANNATVPTTFSLVATSSTCGAKPTASMGFSIDYGSTTIEPTSFTATVNATPGKHVLNVKCWGQGTNGVTPLNINVVAPSTTTAAPTVADITVASPAYGATVASSFNVVGSSSTCGGVPTVSMGYSIDYGNSIIEPASFSAVANASAGQHVLHVKCWGQGTSNQTSLNVTVGSTSTPPPTSSTSDIASSSPANGASVGTPFTVAARSTTCGSVPTTAMGYSIDSGSAVIEPTSFSASVTAPPGAHVLHIKCWGKGTNNQTLLNINVGASGSSASGTVATPQFSLPAGQYSSAQSVSLYDATAGSTIYYTTDGSAPTTASPRYTGPIAVNASITIEAIATASGYTESGLARAGYVVVQPVSLSAPSIPANALQTDMIQAIPGWRTKHDPATGGSASGVMSMTSTPTLSDQTAKFDTSYSSYGGVLYSVTYGKDSQPTNFVYDAHVWIASGSQIGNLEMDNNQVVSNGDTIIYAFQCAGDSNTWDYSENAGTPTNPVVKWVQSDQPCNPQNWAQDSWHHIQIWTSRDNVGNVTYHSVWLDGVEVPINKTVMSAFSLGWAASDLIANFQVDGGKSGGSSTLYLDNFTLYRW
ncbi:MAG: chitobiase/beta-hexosaminidase C-terminal domain-containing protein [Acidobacteriota bacterium]